MYHLPLTRKVKKNHAAAAEFNRKEISNAVLLDIAFLKSDKDTER